MAIVKPGKRPAKRFLSSKVLGGKMQHGRRPTNSDLNVVPMVDMMTMLVVFLLMTFAASPEIPMCGSRRPPKRPLAELLVEF